MNYLRLALVVFNTLAFLALLTLSIQFGRRERYVWVRRLWLIIALACAALLLGSFQRVALQAVSVDLIPDSVGEAFTGDLQLVQSLAVLVLLTVAFITVRRLGDSMDASERLSVSLLDRVRHVDPERLDLTKREAEVLALIGEGVTTDSGLAAELHISASTVQSHVKSLYRKSGLHSRTDLVALAVLVGSAGIGN
jgi:DNA-binding CsgD family transcriptional regulator